MIPPCTFIEAGEDEDGWRIVRSCGTYLGIDSRDRHRFLRPFAICCSVVERRPAVFPLHGRAPLDTRTAGVPKTSKGE